MTNASFFKTSFDVNWRHLSSFDIWRLTSNATELRQLTSNCSNYYHFLIYHYVIASNRQGLSIIDLTLGEKHSNSIATLLKKIQRSNFQYFRFFSIKLIKLPLVTLLPRLPKDIIYIFLYSYSRKLTKNITFNNFWYIGIELRKCWYVYVNTIRLIDMMELSKIRKHSIYYPITNPSDFSTCVDQDNTLESNIHETETFPVFFSSERFSTQMDTNFSI